MLRLARLSDLDLLVRHRRRMWEDMGTLGRGADDASERPYRDWLAPRLASGEVIGWVGHGDAEGQASGLLWFQAWHPRPMVPRGTIPYLLSVFVDEPLRRRGFARAITEAAMDAARHAGHPRIALHASDAGRPLYSSMGFKAGKEMVVEFAAST